MQGPVRPGGAPIPGVPGAFTKADDALAGATKGSLTNLGKGSLIGAGGVGIGAGSFAGGASYGKNKTLDGMEEYMNNQGFMDKLKMLSAYLSGGGSGVRQQMEAGGSDGNSLLSKI